MVDRKENYKFDLGVKGLKTVIIRVVPLRVHSVQVKDNTNKRLGLSKGWSNLSEAEFLQYLFPVGLGPSSNTCPK